MEEFLSESRAIRTVCVLTKLVLLSLFLSEDATVVWNLKIKKKNNNPTVENSFQDKEASQPPGLKWNRVEFGYKNKNLKSRANKKQSSCSTNRRSRFYWHGRRLEGIGVSQENWQRQLRGVIEVSHSCAPSQRSGC